MTDVFTKEKRSKIMANIRSKNTKLEKTVFKELRKRKVYFQKHYNKAPGKPDIALPRKKKAVFIDGDFWHGYGYINLINKLPNNYWKEKITRNIERDKKNTLVLNEKGWVILRVWEHEIKRNFPYTIDKIVAFLLK